MIGKNPYSKFWIWFSRIKAILTINKISRIDKNFWNFIHLFPSNKIAKTRYNGLHHNRLKLFFNSRCSVNSVINNRNNPAIPTIIKIIDWIVEDLDSNIARAKIEKIKTGVRKKGKCPERRGFSLYIISSLTRFLPSIITLFSSLERISGRNILS
ncbi:hypothetical protein SDC9_140743 [bioreactor metagenome]|uniref:Uncharacterized protein n=1 Tax=bioreactor metagenome TaxID=1076179 RepID=A0A645DYD2_9ZZZZ